MTQERRIALVLMGELVTALRANAPDLFKRCLYGGVQDPGKPAVTSLLTQEDADRLMDLAFGRERAEARPGTNLVSS